MTCAASLTGHSRGNPLGSADIGIDTDVRNKICGQLTQDSWSVSWVVTPINFRQALPTDVV